MVRLQFALNPNVQGSWVENHYSGVVHVVDGITEDIASQDVANILLARGYNVYEEPVEVQPEVVVEAPKKVSKTPPRRQRAVTA